MAGWVYSGCVNFSTRSSGGAEPHTVEEIWDGIDVAKVRGWSVVGRGGGTSVAGNAIGDGVVIDTSRYFNRSLEIDVQGRTVTIEPGVIADGFSCRTQIEQGTGSDAKHIAESWMTRPIMTKGW